jgi:hypothetical protein
MTHYIMGHRHTITPKWLIAMLEFLYERDPDTLLEELEMFKHGHVGAFALSVSSLFIWNRLTEPLETMCVPIGLPKRKAFLSGAIEISCRGEGSDPSATESRRHRSTGCSPIPLPAKADSSGGEEGIVNFAVTHVKRSHLRTSPQHLFSLAAIHWEVNS